jgi:hypothetical protein
MPTGTPVFVRIGSNGVITPYYEGHFHGVVGGPAAAVDIQARKREVGQVVTPEYYPNHLVFSAEPVGQTPGFIRLPSPVALIWAEYPSAVEPPQAPLNVNRLLVRAMGAVKQERLLLDANGTSDFVQTLFTNDKLRISYGSQPIFFNGTSATPNWQPVNHGLGVTPKIILMTRTFQDNGWIGPVIDFYSAGIPPNATQFRFAARDELGTAHGPGTIPIPWIAFG